MLKLFGSVRDKAVVVIHSYTVLVNASLIDVQNAGSVGDGAFILPYTVVVNLTEIGVQNTGSYLLQIISIS